MEDLSKPQYYLSIEDRFIDPAKKEIKSNAPIIGDNVYIGPSAKIFGAISTGNNVAIGTNVLMLKDALDNATVVRVQGYTVNHEYWLIFDRRFRRPCLQIGCF